MSHAGRPRASPSRGLAARLLVLLWTWVVCSAPGSAAPRDALVLAVLGERASGLLEAAERGARGALDLPGYPAGEAATVQVLALDDGGSQAGLEAALKTLRTHKLLGVLAVPGGDLRPAYLREARRLRVPWFVLSAWNVDALQSAGAHLWHMGPSIVSQALAAGDALRAPLAARSVAIVHEPTSVGRELAAAVQRNLPPVAHDLGTRALEVGTESAVVAALLSLDPDWVVVAATGASLERFCRALEAAPQVLRCLYADLARSDALRGACPKAFSAAVLLGGPDPELEGRVGERLVEAFAQSGLGTSEVAVRAAEAARRLLTALHLAEGTSPKKILEALAPATPSTGLLGALAFEPTGGIRFFPQRLWRVRRGGFEELPPGMLPTPDCGPPLGFARVPVVAPDERGRIGWLTWGEPPVRTIEQDLKDLQLVSGGYDPELDALVKDEILARAIRIAYRLFRREADGTPIPGWSWGLTLTTRKPAEITPSTVWTATVAGDDPAAGGRVTGSGTVAVYSTFLQRTMYIQHKLEPPLTVADKPLLLARQRWGEDKATDRRGEEIRCLMDGFASAIGMTLAHEYGHLCGCGHDTEHPTSIMNVVAGAGASWADAVWIPSHQQNLTSTLGIVGVER